MKKIGEVSPPFGWRAWLALMVINRLNQGVQYASGDYVAELKSHSFMVSMAPAGNPHENAMMKSFFKTLKYEEVYLCEYERPLKTQDNNGKLLLAQHIHLSRLLSTG